MTEKTTKEKIYLEACMQFYLHGFNKTTMRSLASAVGIKHPSLFAFYSSKAAIAEEIIRRFFTGLQEISAEITEQNTFPAAMTPLVFFAAEYILFENDIHISALVSQFSEENRQSMDRIVADLHHLDTMKPSAEQTGTVREQYIAMDKVLLGLVSRIVIDALSDGSITAYEAAVYFVHKIYDVDPLAFGMKHDEAMAFYNQYWSRIEKPLRRVDVYNDILTVHKS